MSDEFPEDDFSLFVEEKMKDPKFREAYNRIEQTTTADHKHSPCPITTCYIGDNVFHFWHCHFCRQPCSSDNPCDCCEDEWTK